MQHFATATERRGIVFGKRIGDGTEGPPRSFISSNSQLNSARVLPRDTHTHTGLTPPVMSRGQSGPRTLLNNRAFKNSPGCVGGMACALDPPPFPVRHSNSGNG